MKRLLGVALGFALGYYTIQGAIQYGRSLELVRLNNACIEITNRDTDFCGDIIAVAEYMEPVFDED